MLGHPAVYTFVSGAYLTNYMSNSLHICHRAPLGGPDVPFGVTVLWPTFDTVLWSILPILSYTLFPQQISKTTGWFTAILHIRDLKGP